LAGRLVRCPACRDPLRIPQTGPGQRIEQLGNASADSSSAEDVPAGAASASLKDPPGAAGLPIPAWGQSREVSWGETQSSGAASRLQAWFTDNRQVLFSGATCIGIPWSLWLLSAVSPELAVWLAQVTVLAIYFAIAFVVIWLVVIGFGQGVRGGMLLLLLPPYFIFRHWRECRSPCLAGLASFVMMYLMAIVLKLLGQMA